MKATATNVIIRSGGLQIGAMVAARVKVPDVGKGCVEIWSGKQFTVLHCQVVQLISEDALSPQVFTCG